MGPHVNAPRVSLLLYADIAPVHSLKDANEPGLERPGLVALADAGVA